MGGGTTVLIQTIDGRPNDNNVDVNSIQVPYRTPSRAVELHSPSSPSSSNTPAPPFATVRLRSTKATPDLKSAASSWLEVTNRASSNASPLSAPSTGKERRENVDGRLGLELPDSSTSTSRDKPTKLPNGLPSRTTSPTSPEDHVRTEQTSRPSTSTFTHTHRSPNSLHPGGTSSNLSPSERKERRKRRRERLDRPLPPPPDVGLEDEKAERKNENDSLVSM
ncbi:hypothetical protein K435DRAFT_371460 [Dendrothele bispora CBS 962.96]|uniref:Uncharacterized protein n=1 Tax=Dendrothele bispora (strain CBS 962.96) TaxID=1314807 RepID=A0A4S8LCS6_DENBC|nr:hypothetical protein K435DRAFT_371460 [Dendrothele bispora CBS 962.96]